MLKVGAEGAAEKFKQQVANVWALWATLVGPQEKGME